MEDRKHFSRFGALFFAGALFTRLLGVFAGSVLAMWKPEWLENGNINLILSTVIMYFIGMPIMILLVKNIPGAAPQEHSMKWWQVVLAVIMSFPVMYGSNIVGLVLTGIIGIIKGGAVENVVLNTISETSLLLNLVAVVIIAPVMEELVFRKVIVDRTIKYGQAAAALLSALMFGLFHGNLNQFIYAFALGLFLAFIYAKTGRIRYTICIHMTINLMGGVIVPAFMKAADYTGYMNAVANGASMDELMQIVTAHMGAWVAMGLYMVLLFSLAVTGLILFIVFHKKFVFEKGKIILPKGERFKTMILNPGMGLFCVFWIALIIYQLLV